MRAAVPAAATLAVLFTVSAATAQQEARTIAPGMTEQQVRDVFGAPDGRSTRGQFVYYFYNNSNEREYGFPDLVIFDGGEVVDAVLRAPWREYSGLSSSPKGTVPKPDPGGERLRVPGADVQGVQVRPAPPPTPPADTSAADTAEADTAVADTTAGR